MGNIRTRLQAIIDQFVVTLIPAHNNVGLDEPHREFGFTYFFLFFLSYRGVGIWVPLPLHCEPNE